MKILHINTADHGGAGAAALRLHIALLHNNIDSNFLCLNKLNSHTLKCEAFVQKRASCLFRLLHRLKLVRNANEQNTESLKGKVGDYEIFSFPTTDYDIASHHLVKEADIIHLHWVANFMDWHSFFKKLKKPIVWTLHDMNPFSGGFHYSGDMNRNKYIFHELEEKIFSIKINAVRKIEQIHVVCPSNWIRNQSLHSAIFGQHPHYLIHNSVPIDIFRPLDKLKSRSILNLPNDGKIILFVAASITNPRKGFDLLLKAIHCLDRNKYSLAVVGYSTLSGIYQADNVYHLGHITDEEVLATAYSAADLFVIPSIEDNLPNTMIESLSCGTPVVGFNIGGIPDAVLGGFNGFIVDKINSNELYQTIIKALDYNFDRQRIVEDAVKRFGPNVQTLRCLDLYRHLLNN